MLVGLVACLRGDDRHGGGLILRGLMEFPARFRDVDRTHKTSSTTRVVFLAHFIVRSGLFGQLKRARSANVVIQRVALNTGLHPYASL